MSGYTPKPTPLLFEQGADERNRWQAHVSEHGGWDAESKTMKPITFAAHAGDLHTELALDSIAAATEAGVVNEANFPASAFASWKDYETWRESLYEYSGNYWLNDRHFNAFCRGLFFEGEGLTTYAVIADSLAEVPWSEPAAKLA